MGMLKKILKWSGFGVLALVIIGAIYQQIGLRIDGRLAPPPRDMVAVKGMSFI